jgi:spermidine synthase
VSQDRGEARCIFRENDPAGCVEVWDQGNRRSLWFDDVILQSEIDLADPGQLPNPVNRAMLAPLMLNPSLDSVLLAGCGGGAIARWLHARAPAVSGDAVELSAAVARLARDFFGFPPPCSNWRLLLGDVRHQLQVSDRRYDFILVDLAERQVTPPWVTGTRFLVACRDHLSARGLLVLNLIAGSTGEVAGSLAEIRRVFTAGIGLLANPAHDNLLVLAGPEPLPPTPDAQTLATLGRRWGIEFDALGERLRRIPPARPLGR